jgi:hypothetical protein
MRVEVRSMPWSSWWGMATAVPHDPKTYWARYSERLPS